MALASRWRAGCTRVGVRWLALGQRDANWLALLQRKRKPLQSYSSEESLDCARSIRFSILSLIGLIRIRVAILFGLNLPKPNIYPRFRKAISHVNRCCP